MLTKLSVSVLVLALGAFVALTMIGESDQTVDERFRFEISAAREREASLVKGPSPLPGYEHFVSPAGSPNGVGTAERPWDLATALAQPGSVKPGDTIWLRAGTYSGRFESILVGSQTAPIVVRNHPGEHVRLDGCAPGRKNSPVLTINGAATWFWGLEITDCLERRQSDLTGSWPDDMSHGPAVKINSHDTKLINLVVHDAADGIDNWVDARRAEVHGSIVFFNGWDGPDRGHGHGIYVQNEQGSKRIMGNIFFSQFRHGVHAYTSEGAIDNLDIENNISFMNGSLSARSGFSRNYLVGGRKVARNLTMVRNVSYYPINDGQTAGGENNVGYQAGCEGAKLLSNYFVSPIALKMVNCSDVRMKDNVWIGSVEGPDSMMTDENYHVSQPSENAVFVMANAWELGRAHVAVFNWRRDPVVDVDISRIGLKVGDKYELRNVQDYFTDIISGVYDGESIRVPMTDHSVGNPVGLPAPPSTFPEFGAFLLTYAGS